MPSERADAKRTIVERGEVRGVEQSPSLGMVPMSDRTTPGRVTLAAHCAHCGEAVTVHLTDGLPAVAESFLRQLDQFWACPWCYQANQGEFPGHVIKVARRDDTATA